MRTYQHIIDTKAIKQLLNSIPEHCVIRELSERDYGIDLMIEFFKEEGLDKDGHRYFESSGHVCYLQVKGTNQELKFNDNDTISYSIEKKSLYYIEKFPTPFFLTRVYIQDGIKKIFFIWLQRYISDVLDIEDPSWRTNKQKSLTLYIPKNNDFSTNFKKIEKVATRIKYIEELVEFQERYDEIKFYLAQIISAKSQFKGFEAVFKMLRRLVNLKTLLDSNNSCIGEKEILELLDYLKAVRRGHEDPEQMKDFPHSHNFKHLYKSVFSTRFVEEFEAANDGDTTY